MEDQILVPLKRHDHIEEILPYLEKIAHPGMRVVFLIPYPVEPWLWWRDHLVTMESPTEAMRAGRQIMERYSWDVQRGLAEQKVSPARKVLHKAEVEIAVDVYTGSVRKVMASYTCRGDVHLIMMRAGRGLRVMNFLRERILPFRTFPRPGFSPVLLFHPDHGV